MEEDTMLNKLNLLNPLVLAAIAVLLNVPVAHAVPITYVASLDGPSENPVNASPATGSAIVTLDVDANKLQVEVTFSGLLGTVTAAHIHCCVLPPGNVRVATTLPTFPGFPSGVTSGSYDQTFDTTLASTYNPAFITANGDVAGAEAALAAGLSAGQAYLNIHTSVFGGGEIRGFLVPEPQSYALIAIGLLGLACARTRRWCR
jgi:hypothetical protein